jgi:hypothetical protein
MDFLKTPLGIAVMMLVSSFGGAALKDRLGAETRDTALAAKVEALDARLTEIRQDLRDIKIQIDDRSRALAAAERR